MMKFEGKYFVHFKFTKEQIERNLKNALKDLDIARKDKILEVKFNYAYTALIKAGIVLLSYYGIKIKSIPGHHVKIIEKMAQILRDETITIIGNIMRSKRKLDFYAGGIEVTEKECKECITFVENIITKIKKTLLHIQG